RPFMSGPSSEPTFVTTIVRLRLPRLRIHSPMIVSDSPPLLPGTHFEYTSAVSIVSKPAAVNRSSNANEVALSAVQPNTLPPNTSGVMWRPVRPRRRFSITDLAHVELGGPA